MIYYWPGSDHDVPSGGVRTHYDHVRILNAAGIPASILHIQRGFRCSWFAHDVPIVWFDDQPEFSADHDILVINEIMGPKAVEIARGLRKVIFAQNVHYTWRFWPTPPRSPAPYTVPEFVATLVLTDYEREFMRWVWPDHPIYVTPHGIDPAVYPLGREKRRQIAYMPRKHADEAQQVFGYLHARGALTGWDVVAIDGKTQQETAAILRDAMVFVAFGYPEGGTLPPFEAMAAGCYTIGYGGFASDDLMARCGGHVTPSANSCVLAKELDAVLRRDPESLVKAGRNMSHNTLWILSPAKEEAAVVAAWKAIGV